MNGNIWIEIDLKNLRFNLAAVRKKLSKATKVMGVVKQNAYGHGLVPLAKALSRAKVDFLGINNPEEARSLLAARITTPLLVLSNTIVYRDLTPLIKKKVRFTVMDEPLLKSLNAMAKKAGCKAILHIKVDTGMSRLGLDYDKARTFIRKAAGLKHITLEGIYSHLSSAESNALYTHFQIRRFKSLLSSLKADGIEPKLAHLCNSAGLVNFKDAHFDMVRTGLLLYGIRPHPNLKIEVRPVLSLKAKIIHVRKLPKGSFISYANTFRTRRETFVGVVACGYAYGFPWNLSGRANVLIKGEECRVLGRVCMDHIVVDLPSLASLRSPVKVGQTVTLIGKERKKQITAEDLAQEAHTIPYEIVAGLSQDIRRIYRSV